MSMLPPIKEMLRQMIASRSVSSTDGAFDQSNVEMVEILEGWIKKLGFETETIFVSEGKVNLIGKLGEGEGGLVFSGHTDTVPFDASGWDTDPFELVEQEGRYVGLGTCDMKGFFAAALHAVAALKLKDLKQPLYFLATADEESTMNGARRLVELGMPKAKYALIGEPTSLVPVRMHKGIMMEALHVYGKAAHSSQPHLGKNAIEGMHMVMGTLFDEARRWSRGEVSKEVFERGVGTGKDSWSDFEVPNPTLNLGMVHGGDSVNRVCAHGVVSWDVRLMPGMDEGKTRRYLQLKVNKEVDEKFRMKWETFLETVPSFLQPRTSFVKLVEKWCGREAKAVTFCTEAPFLAELGMEVLVLGPGDIAVAHQPNEYVGANELEKAKVLYQKLIEQICIEGTELI